MNIETNYKIDMRKYYLDSAEKYLIKSKTDPENEEEYIKKAEDLIEKARIQLILMKKQSYELEKKPKTKFKDIAGLEKLKQSIKLKIIEPLKKPELFKYFGKKIGGGILMYGPPGCGKSLIAEATAGEAELKYFNIKASDIKSKYVGETEKNIAKLFDEARKNQPCIIFFDEFESIGQERTTAQNPDKSMVSQLLTEIDSMGTKDQQILLLAATNEPWNIDLALRRSGRFTETLFVPPPDKETREQIIKQYLKNKPIEEYMDYNLISSNTIIYSGADLIEICNKAIEKVISECLDNNKIRKIRTSDILEQVKIHNKSITKEWFKKAINFVRNEETFNEINDYLENKAMN